MLVLRLTLIWLRIKIIPQLNRWNIGFLRFSIKMHCLLHKRHREHWIVNMSTWSHEVLCGPCILSELCWLLRFPVLTKWGGVDRRCIYRELQRNAATVLWYDRTNWRATVLSVPPMYYCKWWYGEILTFNLFNWHLLVLQTLLWKKLC